MVQFFVFILCFKYHAMKKLYLSLLAVSILASCSKDSDQGPDINNPSNATELGSLTIPQEFNWSSSVKGSLNVTLDVPTYMGINGQFIFYR